MDDLESEFGPIRKSVHKVNADEIIDDVKLDGKIKKIKLQRPVKRSSIGASNDSELDTAVVTKKTRTEDTAAQPIPLFGINKTPETKTFKRMKHYLTRKLNGTLGFKETKIPDFLENTSTQVDKLLRQCIIQKESHSAILIGPRSNYKDMIIKHHLEALRSTHNEQFIVINLNGSLHSENSAINSIAEQLEFELANRNVNSSKKVKAEELGLSEGTLTEVFDNILRLLDSFTVTPLKGVHSQKEKSEHVTLVFIFDEIDKFAGPVRQTLLYNLFDLVETSRIPVCVLGLTTKLAIMQFLENRVKSRFSQRIIYMPSISDYDQFKHVFKELLEVDDSTIPDQLRWNQFLDETLKNDDSEISRILRQNYENFKDIQLLQNAIFPTVALSKTYSELVESIKTCSKIKKYLANQLLDSISAKILSLSDLELAILISACRVALKNDEHINLTLVHEEFSKLGKIHKTTFADRFKMWTKHDMKNVWENLANQELITERGAISVRFTEDSAIQSANYNSSTMKAPFDLRTYQVCVTLQEMRLTIPKSSFFYSWTQL
ncbi:origin recognition complex subunit 4 [Kluyveromyces lactis]|uniref:Origin recognition complex subunit 4 n=1 Tax=Kluyveromyces lactis (strain ATCC 8585 / CBS 2359 / DSM 70799 / NBRC 1267 / NRRL Y-1140 / WM37) TaxID=284590 RepID=Q6CSY0_KLULA|nr:uncharacterized protein KLLA0_C16984g [Kluyveromyces lactis]CAH01810.1 KLLA0C16984p [Kluyveromyces lactis]|eukprot:XP_452959.1 uncharacterized protein KLLA0_C16984g [Kluyveromyces lactis]